MKILQTTRKLLNNKGRNFLISFQVINGILSVVFGKLVALHIEPESFGKFNIENAAYFFVFSLLLQPFLQYIKANFFDILKTSAIKQFVTFYLMFLSLSISLIIFIFKFYFQENFWIISFVVVTLVLNSIFMLMNDFFSIKAKFVDLSLLNLFKNLFPILFLLLVFFSSGFVVQDGYKILWIAQIVGLVTTLYYFLRWFPFRLLKSNDKNYKSILVDILKYTAPLVLLAFWNWINSFSDRFIIENYLGLQKVGIYNANVGLGSKVFLMINPLFLTLLTPVVFNSSIQLSDRKKKIDLYLKFYFILIISAGLFIFIFKNFIGHLFLSANYEQGFYLIFWSCVSYGLITAGYFLEMIFYADNKTKVILYANIISALIMLGINFIFMPKFGLFVAAIALSSAALVKFLYLRFIYTLHV
ncbi:Membrane protein involved in the export of O-antigen and teichoic acid [Halpernia humi]|uniref:Membrane protein involved in the export of O-antigen and teichoic acid n=1 Tax=Halpernia humi TaxID=493375 RepID=A0A1H6A1R0_9FLAO|nr:hypothetical protein [Halpernia humi]SEG42669.1 Membrane protein involved in the export of O-antigen and teichoic acid [Halpernia humi]